MFVPVSFERNLICFVVACFAYFLAQLFVVNFVAVFAFNIGAELLGKFLLQTTHGFDGFVCRLERANKVLLGNFIHFAFHHHDVFFGSSHHDVHISIFHLFISRIYHVFSVNACNTYLGNRSFKGNVGTCKGCRCSKTCQSVGNVHAVGREKHYVYINFGVVV